MELFAIKKGHAGVGRSDVVASKGPRVSGRMREVEGPFPARSRPSTIPRNRSFSATFCHSLDRINS
jgi:hypothetical protein